MKTNLKLSLASVFVTLALLSSCKKKSDPAPANPADTTNHTDTTHKTPSCLPIRIEYYNQGADTLSGKANYFFDSTNKIKATYVNSSIYLDSESYQYFYNSDGKLSYTIMQICSPRRTCGNTRTDYSYSNGRIGRIVYARYESGITDTSVYDFRYSPDNKSVEVSYRFNQTARILYKATLNAAGYVTKFKGIYYRDSWQNRYTTYYEWDTQNHISKISTTDTVTGITQIANTYQYNLPQISFLAPTKNAFAEVLKFGFISPPYNRVYLNDFPSKRTDYYTGNTSNTVRETFNKSNPVFTNGCLTKLSYDSQDQFSYNFGYYKFIY